MIKLGCVSYINALPLTYGLDPQEVELLHRPPAELLELLQGGKVEAALLPIVNYFEQPGLHLVPDGAIACRGPVQSVRLYLKEGQDIQRLRSIYLDPESRTSHALLKVLLKEKFSRNLKDLEFILNPALSSDAKLLIGDKTFQQTGPSLDLGEEWCAWQKRPFVFAAWMSFGKGEKNLPSLLQKSRKQGLENIDQIIAGLGTSLPPAILKEYFTKNLHYTMGESELDGIRRFYELSKPIQGYQHELHFRFIS